MRENETPQNSNFITNIYIFWLDKLYFKYNERVRESNIEKNFKKNTQIVVVCINEVF
jgi:uncharacterized membrane protein